MLNLKKNNSFVGGTLWTTSSFIVVSLVYILRIAVLTRYLDKDSFGLVAIVLFVLGFTNIFADLGVSTSLLSQSEISKKEYSSLYWGSFGLSIILYVVIACSSPIFAMVYEQEIFNILIPVMGIDLIVASIGRQFAVFKQKQLKFKQLAIIKIVSEVVSMAVAIALAINGFGIWSLVVSLLTTSAMNSLLNIALGYKDHPLIWYFSYKETKHLYRIGFYQTGAQVLDYISSQIDILILGKLLPMSDMGVYSVIKNLVLRVYVSINQIVTKVAVPLFSKLYNDQELFKSKYLNVVSVLTAINCFIYFVMIITAEEILEVFYGKSYLQYGSILAILCIWGVFSSILNCISVIIVLSTGRTDLGFKWTQYRLILNPVFIVIGAFMGGIIGVAISQAVYSILTIFFYREVVIKKIIHDITSAELFKSIYKPLVICILCFPLLLVFNSWLKGFSVNPYINISINMFLSLIVFTFLLGKQMKMKIKALK